MSDNDREKLEGLLAEVAMAAPSSRLEQRMSLLLRPRAWRWLGPACGFAAGVLMTLCCVRLLVPSPFPLPRALTVPVKITSSQAARPSESASVANKSVVAVPRVQVDQLNGRVGDVPVHLERTRRTVLLLNANHAVGESPAQIDLPDTVTVRPIEPL